MGSGLAQAYPSAADSGFSAGTESVFLRNALRREIEELESEAEIAGHPPMGRRLRETLFHLGELGIRAAQAASTRGEETLPPLRPSLFLEEDCVSVVFHNLPTARRLSLDLAWPDGEGVDIYWTDLAGTQKLEGLSEVPEGMLRSLTWLLQG